MDCIVITKLNVAEASGDWHDKPVRWAVTGPHAEIQKFTTLKQARLYRSLRRRVFSQADAINMFVRS